MPSFAQPPIFKTLGTPKVTPLFVSTTVPGSNLENS